MVPREATPPDNLMVIIVSRSAQENEVKLISACTATQLGLDEIQWLGWLDTGLILAFIVK